MNGRSESVGAADRGAVRRQRIVATARKLFIENGFHATGVAQIASGSGVAVGQIYRDFSSKEAIIASIVEADCIDFLAHDTLQRGIDAGDSEAVWEWIYQFFDRGNADNSVLITEIMAESMRNETVSAIFARTRSDVRDTMLAAMEVLVPGDQHIARRTVLADLILALALGLLQDRPADEKGATARVVAAAMTMIRAEVIKMRDGSGDATAHRALLG